MCNIPSLNTRALIIEVLENGKVSLPPFVHAPNQQLTLDELKKCRDYIDLIIANPDNFHVAKPDNPDFWHPSNGTGIMGGLNVSLADKINAGPYCRECGKSLSCQTQTERENNICFNCEKKQILNQSNTPKFSEDGLCMAVNCFKPRPAMRAFCEDHQSCYVGEIKGDNQTYEDKATEVTSPFIHDMNSVDIDKYADKVCGYLGCGKTLQYKNKPQSWAKGECISHSKGKIAKP